MEERCGKPLRVKPPLRQDAGYRQRVRNIRFAGFSKLALMRLFRKGERALDQRDVRRWQIVAKMSGEFGNFRHVWRSPRKGLLAADRQTVLCGLSNISMPTLPAATSRRAMTGGFSRALSNNGCEPALIWRARLVAASVSSKRLGILVKQSSIVMRAMAFPMSVGQSAAGAGQVVVRCVGGSLAPPRSNRRQPRQTPD